MSKWKELPEAARARTPFGGCKGVARVGKTEQSPNRRHRCSAGQDEGDILNRESRTCGTAMPYTVVRADSHEKAVRLNQEYPYLTIFPGELVEVMQCLVREQHQLFKLQEEVLAYKLSCRQNILQTFSPKQWDALQLIMADHP
jgi:hypothetical protein